jgi:hypothetical protein
MRWAALALLGGCEEGGLIDPPARDFVTIEFPGADFTEVRGVNSSGDVVGRYCCAAPDVGEGDVGFVLREGVFTSIVFPGSIFTSSLGINDAGQIVGRYADEGGFSHGYLLSDSSYSPIDFPGATFTTATGINAAGDIVGFYTDEADRKHPYLLSQGRFTTIDVPGAGPEAWAISSDEIAGFNVLSGFRAQVGHSPALFDVPGAEVTRVFGVASDGTIVGWYRTPGGPAEAYLLDDEVHTITVPGSAGTRTTLKGISADGRFVIGDYEFQAFLATREQVLQWVVQIEDEEGSGSGPMVTAADPRLLPTRATLDVKIFGSGFDDGSSVELLKDGRPSAEVQTRAVHVLSTGELIATLDITADAPPGTYDVQVEDRKGKQGIGTELIEIDSTSVSGTWDLTGRVHGATQDCTIAAGLRLSQNDHDIQGFAIMGFTCFVSPLSNSAQMPVTGTLDANGHDLLLTFGDPGCEFQGTHQGGAASGEILPCMNLADILVEPDTAFSGTWQAERR